MTTRSSRNHRRNRRRPPMAALFETRRRGPGTGILVLGLVAILGLAYIALFSAALSASRITVEGAPESLVEPIRQATEAAAETRYGPLVSRSLLVLSEGQVAEAVKRAHPDLSQVAVSKHWPNRLTVTVTERQSQLGWTSVGKTYLIDQSGVAFTQATASTADLTVVEDTANVPVETGKPVAGASFVKFVTEAKQRLQAAGLTVTGFRVTETTFEVQALTSGGYYVLFDTTRPVGNQVDALTLALKTQKPRVYADVRVPGRVYVR